MASDDVVEPIVSNLFNSSFSNSSVCGYEHNFLRLVPATGVVVPIDGGERLLAQVTAGDAGLTTGTDVDGVGGEGPGNGGVGAGVGIGVDVGGVGGALTLLSSSSSAGMLLVVLK